MAMDSRSEANVFNFRISKCVLQNLPKKRSHVCRAYVIPLNTLLSVTKLSICMSCLNFSGRAAWTKHIRKGKELPDIARDDNYDVNFQVRCKKL